jgi:uncharacterized protein (DUF2141 family)
MKKFLYLFLLAAQITIVSGFTPPAKDIVIRVDKIRNAKGFILVALHANGKDFPASEKAFRMERGQISEGSAEIVLHDVPAGRYAIALFHDENNDQKLNTNFLGIPKEGYGFSNNAYHTFRAPDYSEASFQHEDNTILNIHMHY